MMRKIFEGTLLGIMALSIITMQISAFVLMPVETQGAAADVQPAAAGDKSALPSSNSGIGTNADKKPTPNGITNPIKAKNIQCLVVLILQIAVNIGAFASVCYILWAGFLFVSAQGDSGQVTKAKNTLYNAVIGTALIMGAWVFSQIIARTVGTVTGTNITLVGQNQCNK